MSSLSPFKRFVSARATVVLLCVLALMLLLNVVLPQETSIGEEGFDRLVTESPTWHFLLVRLGLGRMPTSPLFLAVLGLFFLNLLAVLASRVGPTLRRIPLRPRSEKGLETWARMEETLVAPLPSTFEVGDVARTLRGFGYQVRRAGERVFWSVKHRTAPLGFLVFHLSFFLLCAGGILIYYTRFVGSAVLVEGQSFEGRYSDILRQPPIAVEPNLAFTVESVETRFEGNQPLHLGADFRFRRSGRELGRSARVNAPARWGSARILVEKAGLAPVLWLQDAQGFTVDQVAVPARTLGGGKPTEIKLDDERVWIFVHPLSRETAFPERAELPTTAMRIQILQDEELVFDGSLAPGEAASLAPGRLVLRELRYWVGVRVIAERGGGLLIAGFIAAVIGLIWRLLWYRREVVVNWDETNLRLVGRAEYFSGRFESELREVFDVLQHGLEGAATAPAAPANNEGSDG
jgi:cytochrome c biogenesis protein ResB